MYRFALPAAPLRLYIESYWFIRSSGAALTLKEHIFVDGRADILFNFGVAYQRHSLTYHIADRLAFSNVDAPREYPVTIAQQGSIDLVGVRFRAGGLAAFTRVPVHHLTNHMIPVPDLLGSGGDDLEGRLYDARDDHSRQVALLDTFFLAQLEISPALMFSHQLAAQIDTSHGMTAIRVMCREVGYSIRTVDRLFRQFYGITPKFYARIARFQRVMQLLLNEPQRPLLDITLECGYYDYSHFSHEFQQLAGMTPENYRAYLATRTAEPPPNLVQMLDEK